MEKHGLPPLIWADSRVLILGSLPGDESIRVGHYYASKRNQFWKILGEVFSALVPDDYGGRLDFLRAHGLALWDVALHAERRGSKDDKMRNVRAVELHDLLVNHPAIELLALNGGLAQKIFLRHIQPAVSDLLKRPPIRLPSSSSLWAGEPFGAKVEKWRAIASVAPPRAS